MRICDRCFNKDGSAVRAVDEVAFDRTSEVFDLCESCMDQMRDMIDNQPKVKRGRKRTRKAVDATPADDA